MSERRMAVSIAARLARVDRTGPAICRFCGNHNDPARVYCSRCGNALSDSPGGRPFQVAALPDAVFPPPDRITCLECGQSCDRSRRFCPNCGTDLASVKDPRPNPARPPDADPSGKVTCGTCGTLVEPTEAFCPNCGMFMQWAGQSGPTQPPAPDFDPNIAHTQMIPQLTTIPRLTPIPPTRPSIRRALTRLFAYVPTSTITVFLPVWSALLLLEAGGMGLGQPAKAAIAVSTAVLAGLAVWRSGYRRVRSNAKVARLPMASVRPLRVLRVGAAEVTAATVAGFAWATAAPSSWAGFNAASWPLATVVVTTIAVAVVAEVASPLEGGG